VGWPVRASHTLATAVVATGGGALRVPCSAPGRRWPRAGVALRAAAAAAAMPCAAVRLLLQLQYRSLPLGPRWVSNKSHKGIILPP
jgi:hypothetical protein